MKKGLVSLVVGALFATLFTACGGGGSGVSSGDNGVKVSADNFNYKLTATYGNTYQAQRGNVEKRGVDIYTGELIAIEATTQEETRFPWVAYINDETFEVNSTRTIVLGQGDYELVLNLSKGSKQYIGKSTYQVTQESEETTNIPFELKPVLGSVIADVNISQEIPSIKLQYDEISDVLDDNDSTSPVLSVEIDGVVQDLNINPVTGLSEMYLEISEGEHNLSIELVEGNVYLGKKDLITIVIDSDSNLTQDLNVDLQPFFGEAQLDVNFTTSSLDLIIDIPNQVIDEVNGLDNLKTIITYTDSNTTGEQEITDIVSFDSDYRATIMLDNIEEGDFSFSLDFIDISDSDSLIGKCSIETFQLNEVNVTKNCDLTLLKRGTTLVGDLQAIVGVHVWDESGLVPISGASIYLDDELLGLSASGDLGIAGYFNFFKKKGTYTLKAVKDGKEGNISITLDALSVNNFDLTLHREIVNLNPSNLPNLSTVESTSIESGLSENMRKLTFTPIFKYGEKIYKFGGKLGDDAKSAISESNTTDPLLWSDIGNLPEANWAYSLVENNGYLYMIGGSVENKIYRAELSNLTKWTHIGYCPVKHYNSSVVVDDYVIVFGQDSTVHRIRLEILEGEKVIESDWEKIPTNFNNDVKDMRLAQLLLIGNNVFGFAYKSVFSGSYIVNIDKQELTKTEYTEEEYTDWNVTSRDVVQYFPTLFRTGNSIFLMGGGSSKDALGSDRIYRADITDPTNFKELTEKLPANIYASSGVLINNSFYIFSTNHKVLKNPSIGAEMWRIDLGN